MAYQPRTVEELLEYLVPRDVSARRPSWHSKAACIGSPVDFFSEKVDDMAAARAVCGGCPVAPQCQHYGADEKFGVWGGVAAVERGYGRRRAG